MARAHGTSDEFDVRPVCFNSTAPGFSISVRSVAAHFIFIPRGDRGGHEVCGWILPNDLDRTLAIYDDNGYALGAVTTDLAHPWRPAPGSLAAAAQPADIQDVHLRRLVDFLLEPRHNDPSSQQAGLNGFVEQFIRIIGNALAQIAPDSAAQHPELALFVGRPLALVRASVNLEVQGLPAIHHGWTAFRHDLQRTRRETDGFTGVEFPIHLGAYHRLNDGLVGFWKETAGGQWSDTFYAPQSSPEHAEDGNHVLSPCIQLGDASDFHLPVTLSGAPQIVAMLIDPRAPVHVVSGFLPAKAITVPPDHYVAALQALEATFFTAPILTEQSKVRLPLPAEPGYTWSWLQNVQGAWREVGTTGIVTRTDFAREFGDQAGAIWHDLIANVWLTNEDTSGERAEVASKDQRIKDTQDVDVLSPDIEPYRQAIEDLLDRSQIGPVQLEATFAARQELREGWLRLRVASSPVEGALPWEASRRRRRT